MTLSAWLRHIKQNKETTLLQFIAKAKCSRANDFGITLSENHFKCAMGSNSSISFDLQCGGEEGGLGNISYHGIVIPALELYNAHAMSTSIIEHSKWPIFFFLREGYLCSCCCVREFNPFKICFREVHDGAEHPSRTPSRRCCFSTSSRHVC